MAVRNGVQSRSSEQTPLLRGEALGATDNGRSVEVNGAVSAEDGLANQQVARGRGFLIILSLYGLIFLQASNMSGLTTTQSRIAEDLDAFAEASWFTSSYLIAMSSLSPIAARLAQIFAPRNCILVAAVLFSLGGVITSQAHSLKVFLLGRAVSGAGGAGIMTIAFILVLELSGKKRRGLFIGLVNTGFTTGVALGAVIAGALLPVTGWRFLFWIQGPLALIAGVSIFLSIPQGFTSGPKSGDDATISSKLARIDYLGAATLMACLITFLFGLSSPNVQWIPVVISLFLLAAFIGTEMYVAAEPIIPISILKSRGALFSCLAQLGIMCSRWMVLFYSPVYAIAVRSWSPASAGSILIPTNLGFAIGGVLAGWLHIKRAGSFWLPCVISYFLFSCSILLLSQISNAETPPMLYLLSVFFNGLCTGAALNYTLAHLLHLTPPSTHFISTSLLTTFRGFAGSFGSAIGGGLFVRVLKNGLEEGFDNHGVLGEKENLIRRLLGSPALVKTLHGFEKDVAVRSYVGSLRHLFFAGAGLSLLMVFVQAGTGWTSGSKEEKGRGLEVGNGLGAEDEEWEEGMEQGV